MSVSECNFLAHVLTFSSFLLYRKEKGAKENDEEKRGREKERKNKELKDKANEK